MFIKEIAIKNYRAFKGKNSIVLNKNGKNIFLVAGDNGFGKTTLLTSLVWCLYGRLMIDVDDKFRREINDAQGYKTYAKQNLNNQLINEILKYPDLSAIKKDISKKGYIDEYSKLKELSQYSVTIRLFDISIPSLPCDSIVITRTYDYITEIESVDILIDDQLNELTKEVGPDIFINDFILSKDIAKFFFFDAEKIVSLAEVRSIEEKRNLSTAYSEVLGIKKYEDIKKNLEFLRVKYRRKSSNISDRNKLNEVISSIQKIEVEIKKQDAKRESIDEDILKCRVEIESLQEQLIREGNAISVEELIKLKEVRDSLKLRDTAIKAKLKEMLDIAPFAIAGEGLVKLYRQVSNEQENNEVNANISAINAALNDTYQQIDNDLSSIKLSVEQKKIIKSVVESAFNSHYKNPNTDHSNVKILLDFSDKEQNEFKALFDNIKYSFSQSFKQIIKDDKNNRIFLNKTLKSISLAESDDNNAQIRNIRGQKANTEAELQRLERENRKRSEDIGLLKKELAVKNKQYSELAKKVSIDDSDKEKDIVAERLIDELSEFLFRLKSQKKTSLESRILQEIKILMHKQDFIHNVRVDLTDDIIDILLFDEKGEEISREKLSKGEQQLYATSILKALVDESEIKFPVFIDSPLQKFDSRHSRNIITEFYPNVSDQVVIFPLLGKELSAEEYEALLPNVNSAYVIRNSAAVSSLHNVEINTLFDRN